MRVMFAEVGADWETIKVLVGGGVGIYAIWQLVKIVRWTLDLVQLRDKNQVERDDKRDKLLEEMKATIASQDVSFRKQCDKLDDLDKLLMSADETNRKYWAKWDQDRQMRLSKKGGDQ